jgi:HD-GYP domain-containing protein (c-di-GMP phosphodiesterase class II)
MSDDKTVTGGAGGNVVGGVPAITYSANQLQRARELLSRFYAARRAARFYPPGHPATDEAIASLQEILETYHAEGADVVLTFFDDELLLGEQLLTEESVLFDQLIREMVAIGAGNVVFFRGVETQELGRALVVLALDVAALDRKGGLVSAVRDAALSHIAVSAVAAGEDADRQEDGEQQEAPRAAYNNAVELMRDLEAIIRRNGTIYAGPVRGVVKTLLDNVLTNRSAMLELSGLKDYDEYTFYHSVNVTILSLALGSNISRDPRFLATLGVGALMHDIGKIVIDVETLNKPGALDPEEWSEVRKHPLFGAEQAALTPGLDKAAVVVILEHHMRYDSCGYPQRFPVRPQHLASRVVAIADAYDAMTSRRSYSAARLPDEAIAVLAANVGTAFDPVLVRLFIDMMGCYPPRAVVRLTTGETAVVTVPNEGDPLLPHVRVFADASGAVVEPFDVDLLDAAGAGGRAIERCLDPAGLNVDISDFLPA